MTLNRLFSVLIALVVAVSSFVIEVPDAEARRLGGGRSFGYQRSVTPRSVPRPPSQATPQRATGNRSWMGPVAGLAAGLGIAALMSSMGFGPGMANFVTLALLIFGGLFIFRRLLGSQSSNRSATQTVPDVSHRASGDNVCHPNFGGGAQSSRVASTVPSDFDTEEFLRVAKRNFIRLQAANDAGNLDDMREFLAPEVFAEIKLQLDERYGEAQQTDVVTLNAELLELSDDNDQHVASVHFSGMIRETEQGAAEPFSEIWHLKKPVAGNRGWMVSGIQQVD